MMTRSSRNNNAKKTKGTENEGATVAKEGVLENESPDSKFEDGTQDDNFEKISASDEERLLKEPSDQVNLVRDTQADELDNTDGDRAFDMLDDPAVINRSRSRSPSVKGIDHRPKPAKDLGGNEGDDNFLGQMDKKFGNKKKSKPKTRSRSTTPRAKDR